MQRSNLKAINGKNLETYLINRIFDPVFFSRFFPLKMVTQLVLQTLIGTVGNRVAADVTAFNATAPVKRRQKSDETTTRIPAIRISRIMDENDLNEYYSLLANASDEAQRQALAMVYDDVDFVVDGCTARMEHIALQAMSQVLFPLNTTNNAGIVTTSNIDMQLPAANKEYIGSAGGTAAATHYWTTAAAATNDPITDIEAIVLEAEDSGKKISKMYMNKTKWLDLRKSTAFQNFVLGSSVIGGNTVVRAPKLEEANIELASYDLPTIEIINTRIDIETGEHDRTSTDPWLNSSGSDNRVLFTGSGPLGNMLYSPTAEERTPVKQATYAKKGPILVSKYSTANPVNEVTVGLINAFPSWTRIDEAWSLNTESHTAWA